METVRRVGVLAVAAAILAWSPGQAEAQDVGVGVDAWGGIAFPASNLREFQDVGPSFGLGVEYLITDHLFVRGSGAVDLHNAKDADEMDGPPGGLAAPDVTLFHVTGGVGVNLAPAATNWDISVSIEAGGTSVTTDDFPAAADPRPSDGDFSETYVTLSPGLRVGYLFAGRYNLFVRSQPHFTFADSEDTEVFTQFDADIPDGGIEDIWNVPVAGGIQIRF